MRKNSVKNVRVNSEVMRVLAGIIRELKDPRVGMLTSVVDVQVSPDLKTAKVWISAFGDEEEQSRCLEGIKSAEGYIRNQLARELNLRNTPQLTFIMDDSIAYGVNMSKKIREVIGGDD